MTTGHHNVGEARYGGKNARPGWTQATLLFERPSWPHVAPPERHLLVNLRSMPSPRTKEVPRDSDFFSQKWAPSHQAPSTSGYLSRAEPLVCYHPGQPLSGKLQLRVGRRASPLNPGSSQSTRGPGREERVGCQKSGFG